MAGGIDNGYIHWDANLFRAFFSRRKSGARTVER
jgi:hypothetical protein